MTELFDIPGLRDLTDGDLALCGETMADFLEGHPAFKGLDRPDWLTGPVGLREDAHQVKVTSNAARLNPSEEPNRLAARDKMIQSIKFSCQFAVMYAAHTNDPSHLDDVPVDRIHRTPRSTEVKLPKKFNKAKVSHGEKSGTVKFYVSSWEGKGSVEAQICYGDPALEQSWQPLRISHYCHFTVEDLEPARRAYFRVRLMNDAGVGPWSDVMALIIL